ncbi:MAG TPA: hypothetical protein VKQ72_01495 [Aggregatilineales bacterium]|nr:hypothetical protein [Aggregatilineales bacterium]
MLTLFDRLFPFAGISEDNPEFVEGLQRIKWLRTKKALLGYSLILTYCVAVVCIGFFMLRDASHTLEGTRNLLAGLLAAALLAALASDINVARLARAARLIPVASSTQDTQNQGQGDNTGLASQPLSGSNADKAKAHFVLLQIRAWRLMAIEIAFRVTLVTILAVCFLNLVNWPLGDSVNELGGPFARLYDLSREQISSPGVWAVLLGALLLVIQQALEPIWRMRSLAARELFQDTRQRPGASIGNIALGWLTALGSYVVPGAFLVIILKNAQLTSVGLGLVSFGLIVSMGTWGLYDWLQQRAFQALQPLTKSLPEEGQYFPGQ